MHQAAAPRRPGKQPAASMAPRAEANNVASDERPRPFASSCLSRHGESLAAGRQCPQRDSNPRYGLERAATWAASRWGPGRPRIAAPFVRGIPGRETWRVTEPTSSSEQAGAAPAGETRGERVSRKARRAKLYMW